jgi:hypothetical protein
MKAHIPVMLGILMILPTLLVFIPVTQASTYNDFNIEDIIIKDGEYHVIDLGTIDAGMRFDLDDSISTSEDIDALLMDNSQYQSWKNGGSDYIRDGSSIDADFIWYTYTIQATDHYWYVLENSDQTPNGANAGEDVTVEDGGIDILDALDNGIETQVILDPDTHASFDIGTVNAGDIIDFDLDCSFVKEIDVFVVSSANIGSFESGSDTWNRNASYLNECHVMWSYQVEVTDSWTVYLENGPRGEAETEESLDVGISISVRSIEGNELISTSRMIDAGGAWRVDLGDLSAGDSLGFVFDGKMGYPAPEVDFLIMESSQVDTYLSGGDAVILGHASVLNYTFSGLLDTWDYRIARDGTYSILVDNSVEPQDGTSHGSAVHVSLSVLRNLWSAGLGENWVETGYVSRHYVEEGGFVSFDLGDLGVNDRFTYMVFAEHHASSFSIASKFDVLVFDDASYQTYKDGGNASPIPDLSDLDGAYASMDGVVTDSGHYWVVIDVADGPEGGADAEGGAWTFDFRITSDGSSISSPQAEGTWYEITKTSGGNVSIPDAPIGGDDDIVSCWCRSDSGAYVGTGNTGSSSSNNGEEGNSSGGDSGETPGFGALMTLSAIGLVALIRRKRCTV